MRSKIRKSGLLVVPCLAGLLMVGCNAAQNRSTPGSSGTGSNSATMPAGIYTGNASLTGSFSGSDVINTAPYLLGFVTSTGNYMLLSYSYNPSIPNFISQMDTGTASVSDGSFTASDDQDEYLLSSLAYASTQTVAFQDYQDAALSATYVPNQSITGTITYPGIQHGVLSFPMVMVQQSNQPASMSTIAGTYTGNFFSAQYATQCAPDVYCEDAGITSTITITSAGVLSGTVSALGASSTVSGTVSARSDIDAYNVSISFSNGAAGALPGTWVTSGTGIGLGYYNPTTRRFMFGALTSNNTPFGFSN